MNTLYDIEKQIRYYYPMAHTNVRGNCLEIDLDYMATQITVYDDNSYFTVYSKDMVERRETLCRAAEDVIWTIQNDLEVYS